MNNKIVFLGKHVAQSLFTFGNTFNMANTDSEVKFDSIFEEDDFIALSSDWEKVGEGVELALEQYRDSYKREPVNNFT